MGWRLLERGAKKREYGISYKKYLKLELTFLLLSLISMNSERYFVNKRKALSLNPWRLDAY